MSKRQCTTEGCENPHRAKGLCMPCYMNRWRAEHVEETRATRRAHYERTREKSIADAIRWAKENLDRKRAARRDFYWRHVERIREANRERGRRWREENPDLARERMRAWSAAHPERGAESTNRRRARLAEAPYEPYKRRDIFERDEYRCYICGGPTGGKCPDPESPSIDHVIPISLRGGDTPANVRCAHLRCNISKGNKPPEEVELCVA